MMKVVSALTAGVAATADDAAGAAAAGRRAEARVRAVDRCCVRGAAGCRAADGAARGLQTLWRRRRHNCAADARARGESFTKRT